MAGTQNIGEASNNPVAINVTAMVDVIFCLCLFFMCSLHFKQLEGKVDAWLPKEKGNLPGEVKTPKLEEIRIFLRWDPDTGKTIRSVGHRPPVSTDEQLIQTLREMRQHFEDTGKLEVPILIDAMEAVPWQEVVHVLDLCNHEKFGNIEFVEPMQYQPK